jgi:hypothetical protein
MVFILEFESKEPSKPKRDHVGQELEIGPKEFILQTILVKYNIK